MEGKFDIADSIQVECEVGGEMTVGGKLVIGEKGGVSANVQTVDAIVMGHYSGNMIATGNVEITETGRVTGNITTDSLVISKGGFFNGNVTKMNDSSNGQRPVYHGRRHPRRSCERPEVERLASYRHALEKEPTPDQGSDLTAFIDEGSEIEGSTRSPAPS